MNDARGLKLRKNDNVCYIYRHFNHASMSYGKIVKFDKRYVYVQLEHSDIIERKLASSLVKIPKIKNQTNNEQ